MSAVTDAYAVGEALAQKRLDSVGPVELAAERAGIDLSTALDIENGRFERVSFAAAERYCEAIGLAIVLQEIGE